MTSGKKMTTFAAFLKLNPSIGSVPTIELIIIKSNLVTHE